MTEQQRGLILLIKSASTGQVQELPTDFDLVSAFDIAKKHGITALAYYGACKCGVDTTAETMQSAFSTVCKCILTDERQRAELTRLLDSFDKHGIKYMPLKGVNLKSLYLTPEMRMMGDADILISPEQYDGTIRPLMIELGYEEGAESDHELIWNKSSLHVELHKRLIPSYNKDYYAYFGDGWSLAKIKSTESERYSMTDEDELIYLFTHFAKHYRDSGIGLRHIIDLWVYESHHPNMARDYLTSELHKLQLDKFYLNIKNTLDVWFNDAVADEITDFITDTIFKSGQYGKKQVGVVSSALKESKSEKNANKIKLNHILRSAFQSVDYLKVYYPILNKAPVFLPFIWVIHFLRRVFTKNKLKNYVKNINEINDDKISEYQKALNFVGLDFNFK
ncbi:MAG: nucleotidyltransferase family protein [Clostridia bacterium]|nr:nucleotidyltransferase family protein [Clostridia bacterium]